MRKSVIFTSPLPIMSPIIKIVGNFCNLRCDYCFYNSKDQECKTVMDIELLKKFIKEYLELFNGNLRFTWHGGEPLLAGLGFFKKIVEFQKCYSRKKHNILNTVQTNGTLINKNWADFFKKNGFRIGVSIDGIKECHDKFRKDKNGNGSFDRTVRGIRILQKYNIPVSVLSTLTNFSIKYVKENFRFLVESLKINVIANNYVYDPEGIQKHHVSSKNLAKYLKTLTVLWLEKNDPNLRIREIENHMAGIIGKKASLCSFNGWCTAFFCLEHDGKIYPCDKLSGNKDVLFGDLYKNHLIDILNSKNRTRYADSVNNLNHDCSACKWRKACNNGCRFEHDKNGRFYYCDARKEFFAYLTKIIKKERRWEKC